MYFLIFFLHKTDGNLPRQVFLKKFFGEKNLFGGVAYFGPPHKRATFALFWSILCQILVKPVVVPAGRLQTRWQSSEAVTHWPATLAWFTFTRGKRVFSSQASSKAHGRHFVYKHMGRGIPPYSVTAWVIPRLTPPLKVALATVRRSHRSSIRSCVLFKETIRSRDFWASLDPRYHFGVLNWKVLPFWPEKEVKEVTR